MTGWTYGKGWALPNPKEADFKGVPRKDKFRLPYGIYCTDNHWVSAPDGWCFTEIDAALRLLLGDVLDYSQHYKMGRKEYES